MILASSCICLWPIYWSRVLSTEWRCSWSSADRRCSNYIWVINNLIAYKGATYIRDLTVYPIWYACGFVVSGFVAYILSWWCHQMETFSTLLALCEGNPPVTGGFPSQRPVTQSFDVFFDLCRNKRLSKQLRHWWFEKSLHSLWCHTNECF